MPLILSGNVATALGGAYEVANSCRFDGADSLQRSKGTQSSLQKGTYSFWIKRTNIDGTQHFVYSNSVDASNKGYYSLRADEKFRIVSDASSGELVLETSQLFRDPTAWMNIVIRIDTTQGTAANRCIFYINGVAVTALDTTTYPDQNANLKIFEGGESDKEFIGGMTGETSNLHLYLSEFVFCDGQSLGPTSFGEFDEDSPTIWKPIDVSGLTFGNQGWYLDFEDSSALGNSSNSNNFGTVNNLAAIDQTTDTCTNNFATLNPLDNFYANAALSEGNLKMVSGSSRECSSTATIALSNGKWFWEYEVTSISAPFGGIQPIPSFGNTASAAVLQTNGLGYLKTGKVETTDGSGGSTVLASYATYAANDIIGVALDLDASTNIIYFYKNGVLQGSGVNLTHVDSTANGHYLIAFGAISGQSTFEINFGNPITALDSANADANGYGAFEFTVPSGFYSICSKNLAEYG